MKLCTWALANVAEYPTLQNSGIPYDPFKSLHRSTSEGRPLFPEQMKLCTWALAKVAETLLYNIQTLRPVLSNELSVHRSPSPEGAPLL
jgi:hypothetical protein